MLTYYNRLPQSVMINKTKYAINTDYRMFLDFETEMNSIDRKEAVNNALYRFFPDFEEIIKNGLIMEAVEIFIWFYKCGIEDYQQGRSTKSQKKATQIYNYNYDAQMICGAYAMYGYDLHRYMHWWKFKEIWNSLPADCEYSKIKSYRAYDGTDKDQLELKEFYKLPPTMAEIKDEIRRAEIFEQLK